MVEGGNPATTSQTHTHTELKMYFLKRPNKPDVFMHDFNLSIQEAYADRSLWVI